MVSYYQSLNEEQREQIRERERKKYWSWSEERRQKERNRCSIKSKLYYNDPIKGPIYRYKKNIARKARYGNEREQLILLLGDKCMICGFIDKRCLQLDHKNGGGTKETTALGRGSYVHYYLIHPDEALSKLTVLCANCNWIKRCEKNEARGRKRRDPDFII